MKYEHKEQFEKNQCIRHGNGKYRLCSVFHWQFVSESANRPERRFVCRQCDLRAGVPHNWHIHHADKGGGQLLICTAGEGWYQEEGKAAVSLHEGSVVMIPANVKHWHGAKKDSWFSHIAVEVPGEHCKNEWCEPVSDEEYTKL